MNTKILCLSAIAVAASLLFEGVVYSSEALEKTTFQSGTSYRPQPSLASEFYLAQQARTYKVKLGDTVSGIAYKNSVSVQQLLAFNPSLRSNPHLIRVGQVIYLSKQRSSTTKPPTARRPQTRQSIQTFNLPNQRRIASSRVGARRGDPKQDCRVNSNDNLTVLLPDTNFGYTLQDYPTFFWYMPQLKTAAQRFELKVGVVEEGAKKAESFKTYQFASNNQNAGVMSITLPQQIGPLEEGKEYQWEVRIYCTAQMFISATGNIERQSTNNSQLTSKLENTSVEDYPAILGQAGVWYDALAILAGLREDNPTDASLSKDWAILLKMIGFENITSAPLLASEGRTNN